MFDTDVFQIVEDDSNGIKFNCRHHYENNIRTAGDNSNPARTRRLAQEAVTLSTSLPLSAGSSVFVRCDEERLDVMKVCSVLKNKICPFVCVVLCRFCSKYVVLINQN